MGGGSSSPKYMDEIVTPSNKPNKENFVNKNNKFFYIIFGIIILVFLYLLISYFYKKRYKG
jgi:magnesium-transporting ATPase (P-type)